jgi:hypothetical protein
VEIQRGIVEKHQQNCIAICGLLDPPEPLARFFVGAESPTLDLDAPLRGRPALRRMAS